MNNYVMIVLFN